jgi:hypothetical protein
VRTVEVQIRDADGFFDTRDEGCVDNGGYLFVGGLRCALFRLGDEPGGADADGRRDLVVVGRRVGSSASSKVKPRRGRIPHVSGA